MAEVSLQSVSKSYGKQVALDGVDMTIPDGSFVVLLGPTGAGKTTTLRMVSGLDKPDAGKVLINGQDVAGQSPAERNMAMVFQQYSLYPHLTVRQNLEFPLKSPMLRTPADEIKRKVAEVAEVLQIGHKLDNKATALSGGEMQRVSIGRALVRNPQIYLMDEPPSSLDAKLRSDFRIELKRIQASLGATMLYVTHDQIEAMTMATHVFASPPVDAVLAGILAVSGPAGCLLIVKNYTGDRLNFGLAAERARAYGIKVAMVIVDDDIALPDLPQARGVAGTLFVHKIAGALAESGADLDTVCTAAKKVVGDVASIGMSLDTCTVPGSPKEERIAAGKAELGLGIHGESGVELVDFEGAQAAMALVLARLKPHAGAGPKVALLNNLGGATPLEMAVLAEELAQSDIIPDIQYVVGPAPMMTSLDMRGFSVSLLPVQEADLALLQSAVPMQDWPGCLKLDAPTVLPIPDGLTPIKPIPSAQPETAAFLAKCCDVFLGAEAALNALDAQSGDGDTGSTLAGAARALKGAIPQLPLADATQLYRAIGLELSQTMGGSSGVLLAIFFSATGDALSAGLENVTALKAGLKRVQEVGGAALGDRTMIDALTPALAALPQGYEAAASAARKGATHTASIVKAKAGRASYISEDRLSGYNDPGAEAVALLFEALCAG